MQAAAWLVRPSVTRRSGAASSSTSPSSGLVLCAVAGVLATAYLAGRSAALDRAARRAVPGPDPGFVYQLGHDRHGPDRAGHGGLGRRRRSVLAGVLFGLAIATKFYRLSFAALFLLCLRAGGLRAFWVTAAGAAAAWLVVNVPVAVASSAAGPGSTS